MLAENEMNKKSEFNMAVSYLNRLDKIFFVIDEARISEDHFLLVKSIKTLFFELSTELTEEEISKYREDIKNIEISLSNIRNRLNQGLNVGINRTIIMQIDDTELFLRSVLKRSGLQFREREDEYDDDYED